MHMPGHKRNGKLLPMGNPYELDITEIDGFDNLHQAEGILKDLAGRISKLYLAGRSYPLVNGSTAGILAGISAVTNKGDKILIARNCHKSVYHASILRELKPIYLYPQYIERFSINGGILASEVEELLINHADIKLVVITSPTYEGVVSDIEVISQTVHRYGALLLVDEAHGAHFGFDPRFPKSAVTLGADIVIQSLHKTLPSFTQTAVLHSNRMDLNNKIEKYLKVYQSSSPSYLLLAGVDRCIGLLEDYAKPLFDEYYKRLESFYTAMKALNNLFLLDRTQVREYGIFDLDPSKLSIIIRNASITGHQLGQRLREEYKIVMEMEAGDYVLGMTSISDTKEGFDRLGKALLAIDQSISPSRKACKTAIYRQIRTRTELEPYEAVECKTEIIKRKDSCGRVSSEFISLFPPGAPLLVPGEVINKEFLSLISNVIKEGLTISGLKGSQKEEIEVICS
ncbi:MAG: speA 1 [Herbinix sp.]|jgi:arginine/lysine/ornithine decarboxylase|nr:speA 1 [Herbinix sp.]